MSNEKNVITVDGIAVEVVRKDIKNLNFIIYAPDGRVRVAVPLRVGDEAVRLAVISKLVWIKRQQAKFESRPRPLRREMVSGETHYFLGRRYRLHVIEHHGAGRVMLRDRSFIDLYARPETSVEQREQVLQRWYREQLRALVPPLLDKWQPALGVQVRDWGIKRMRTRWGSCSLHAHRVWLNLELAKKPAHCLEYVVVHELVHLLELHHNDRFVGYMDKFMPQWRLFRDELNRAPLGHESWECDGSE